MFSNIVFSILSTLSKWKTTLSSLYAVASSSSTSSPSNLAGRLVCTKRRKLLLLSWRAKDFISFHMNKEGAALCLSHTFKFLVAVRTEFFVRLSGHIYLNAFYCMTCVTAVGKPSSFS